MHPVIDAHIHIQPFHMMRPDVEQTFWHKKPNRAELESLAEDPARLLRQMDADGIERVGLINYVSPEVMGFTAEVNAWMMNYASAEPSRSEEHTSELQSPCNLVCRLLLEKKNDSYAD